MTKQDNKNSNEDKNLTEHVNNECIHTILERQVELKPDLAALQFRQTGLSYSRLNIFINQFAYHLIDLGVHRGVCVGLAMERSFELAIAIFAVLKAGGAYVPVDPEYPDERIQFVFNDADVNILITQEKFSEKFKNYPQQLLKPDISDWAFGDFPTANPSVQVTPQDLAYILFTSGSTGKPKGVMVEHHSVVNLIRYIQRLYPIAEGDVVLLKSPYTFDGSVWELYGWLIPCGTLYIADPGIEKDPALLLNLIVSCKVSFTFFVSSMLSAFLEYIELSGNKIVANNVKWVSVGGEVVSPSLVQRFYKIFGKYGTLLFNVYGPTETTVYATTYLCRMEDTDKTPVGKAVDNDFIYILDESMKPVETMNEGEIFIGGEGVARGYLNRPELDSQKFLPNPFRAGEKIYATGDIGRFLPDGNLDFIGRRDFQVKMRGLRIELGEIENAMLAIPGIRDAAVIFTKDSFNDDSLIAFLVPETDSGIMTIEEPMPAQGQDRELIAVELLKSLPAFMIPSEFVVCRLFPLSENGKLDRKALKLPKNSGFARSGDLFSPSSPIEIWLAEMWQEVLSVEKISVHDSFFKLGGHSLKAASIAARISGKYGIEMPIKTIFENPTIFKLAKFLNDNIQPENRPLSLIPAVERNKSGYPLNANQLELWFLHKMDTTRIMHNILFRLDIHGNPDIVVFQKAINALIDSNEILRTAIRVQNGIPLQFLNEPYKITIPVINLKELSQNAIELRLSEAEKTIGRKLFNLETGRLFSLDWFQTSEKRNIVYFCIHHIIFDGWSMFNFFNGFKQAYLNIRSELPVDLPKPEIQNIDFAVYQQNSGNQEKLTDQLEYWKKVFAKLPQPLIMRCRKPFDLTKVAQAGKRIWWKAPENELTALKSFAVEHDCTLFALLLSIYKITLSDFSGNSDIVVGTPYANRRRQETEPLIGYFTNMIALRDYLSADEPFSSFVKKVQLTSLDAFANVDLPFGQIVRSLGLITSPGRYPIFQVVFVLQNWAMPAMKFAGIELSEKELGSGGVKVDIMLNAEETGNELECWLEYDLALFDEESVVEMVNFFNQTIRMVIENPDIPIGKLLHNNQSIFNANPDGFSCVLIGETGLLTECGEILLRHGFVIKVLISPDPSCISWGKNKGIGLVSGYEAIQSVDWNQVSCDYLFSIVNSKILKKETLLAVRKACINYHDSPLPYYAGVHATSWALMRGEETHGVSWHVMTEETDAGGVVASAHVEVSADDTAFTLNARCFEAALQSFHQVIDTLRNGVELPSVSIKPLSYFSLHQKPYAAGILDFRQPASELYNMVRGLNLGDRFDNRLASPKLLTNTGVFLVQRANHIVQKTTQKPGTVLGLKGQEVTIAAADGALVIKAITKLSGSPVPVGDLFYDKAVNVKLPVPTQEKLLSIDQLVRKVVPNEPFWIRKLSLVSELVSPVLLVSTGTWKTAEILVNSGFDRDLNAALMFFLASYSNSIDFTAGISNAETCRMNDESFGIFADVLPFVLPSIAGLICEEALAKINKEIENTFSRGTFLFDLIARTPELKRKFAGSEHPRYHFILAFSAETAKSLFERYSEATVLIPGQERITVISQNSELVDEFQTRMSLFFQLLADKRRNLISSVNMLTASELKLHELVNIGWDLKDVIPFLQQFDQQVKCRGDKVAIEFENQQITYNELNHRSKKVADFIFSETNGSHGNIIGICLERSPEFIISILGIFMSGNAYLPIDPGSPPERIKAILTDSGVSHIISAEKFREIIPVSVQMHDIVSAKSPSSLSLSEDIMVMENLPAYVIYTSGTTGKPKGVVITRRSLNVFISGCIERYSLTAEDRVLQFASLAFDASVEEIFPTLACGATLVMRTRDSISSVNRFLDFCRDKALSVLDLPTAFWRQLIDHFSDRISVHYKLRLIIIGGERAGNTYPAKWLDSPLGSIMLYNTYGPTETTVVATAYKLPIGQPVNELPIGKPVFGATAIIRNIFGQLGIPTMPNEMLIGGEIVSPGYLNQAELTEAKFITVTEGEKPCRFYSSGDLVTILPDGNLLFAGRVDEQLKIRGFRVEISEIQAAINQLHIVTDCVVVPVKSPDKEVKLVAYIVLTDDNDISEVQNLLRSGLPDYMIPAQFICIPFIPMTINHKPDFKALPAPDFNDTGISMEEQPVTNTEKIIFSAWEKQLGTGNFGINHDFFKLGGHSLMALAIMSQLELQTGKTIPLASLFTFPTVKTLAAAIDQEKESEAWRPLVCIKPGSGRTPLFIIHGGGLNILLFNTLVQKMASGQPVYGIQAHGLDGKSAPYTNIEDIATHYMREIRSVTPKGPYALAGFSIGGLIAHELCCRFAEKNEPVVFLGMFDTAAVSNNKDLPKIQRTLLWFREKIMHTIFNLRIIITDPLNAIPKKLKWLKYRLKMKLLDQDAVNREDLVDLPSHLIYVAKANIEAISAMKLRYFPGVLHLFRAGKRSFYVSDPVFLGWKKYAQKVVVHPIPGEHSRIFAPPNDSDFGEKLQKALDEAT